MVDPDDSTSLRYWDGRQWTDQRIPRPSPPPPTQPVEGESRRTIGGVEIYVWVLIIFAIVASVGGFTWLNYL